jgi:quercetin dioxygenase-like cupin family protein
MITETTMLHADRTRTALVHGAALPWLRSPEPGVERRLLERAGGEVALATSIVRYAPGSRFATHEHALGEEFLVLEGTFSDEHGHYQAGTYVRNPPGSRHAPFSVTGCVIFVKLRQMHPADRHAVRAFAHHRSWQRVSAKREECVLHQADGRLVQLQRLAAGGELALGGATDAQELFVVDGAAVLHDGATTPLQRWGWLRRPQGAAARVGAPDGALLWTQRGHLPAADTAQRS